MQLEISDFAQYIPLSYVLRVNVECLTTEQLEQSWKLVGDYKRIHSKKNKKRRQNRMPMKCFSPKESLPSEKTLQLIKQIAYTYRVARVNGKNTAFCLN